MRPNRKENPLYFIMCSGIVVAFEKDYENAWKRVHRLQRKYKDEVYTVKRAQD